MVLQSTGTDSAPEHLGMSAKAYFVITIVMGGWVLLIFSGERSGMLLNFPQHIGKSHSQE